METKVEELEDSKVRLEVEVPEAQVQHAFEHAASDLAADLRVPGFRKGKVPLPVVAARVGKEALSAEAVRSHIDGWFWDAATRSGVRPVAAPEVEWAELPTQGGPFRFTATVPVAPKPDVPDWTSLDVPAPEPEVPAELVDAELERLRNDVAALVPVSGRPAQVGDTLVVDLVGKGNGEKLPEYRDYVVELGAGGLVDDLEVAIVGMTEGETKEVELTGPDGSQAVLVKATEIKEKVLPALDDELARAASEFETLGELRADIEARLQSQLEAELEARFREDALDAVVETATVTGIEPLVERRAAALLSALVRSLEQRGITVDTYLRATGRTAEAIEQSTRTEAERAIRRELVLEAVADKLGTEIPDEEIIELISKEASEAGEDPDATVEAIRARGDFDQIRHDLRLRKALDEIAAGVKRIPVELAQAREKLWTPEKENVGSGMKIWTPGSEEKP